MLRASFALVVGLSLAAVGAACSDDGARASAGGQSDALRPIERFIVGRAAPYEPDRELRGRTTELAASQKKRRAAAWEAVARVLRPVPLAERAVTLDAGAATLPAFRTWHDDEEFRRILATALAKTSAQDRAQRRQLTDDEIETAMATDAHSRGMASDEDYALRIARVMDHPSLDGIGSNARVSYSPGAVAHLMKSYGRMLDCLTPRTGDPAPSATSFAPCLDEEMPASAAIVKTDWRRAALGSNEWRLPVFDTSGPALAKRIRGESDEGGWGSGTGEASPRAPSIYEIRLTDDVGFRLTGMHLITKELRDWLWITLWWSPDGDADFGADRPEIIRALGEPWSHYKMCVVTSYDERDPDPRGSFDGSLGDALEAVHAGAGGPTWCSNPYIERGAHNAQTNCIGCHQHAATDTASATILGGGPGFPQHGRTRQRQSFLSDYIWSLGAVSGSPRPSLADIVHDLVGDE